MKRIYISIPITGHNLQEQAKKAGRIANGIEALGHEAVSPFDTAAAPSHYDKQEQYAYYLGRDIERLLLCDGVYFAHGWEDSKGCRIEGAVAQAAGIPVYFQLDKIPEAE